MMLDWLIFSISVDIVTVITSTFSEHVNTGYLVGHNQFQFLFVLLAQPNIIKGLKL
jgi:hypothetical protein